MSLWGSLFTAVKGGANEAAEKAADANAVRILDQQVRDADAALIRAQTDLAGLFGEHRTLVAYSAMYGPAAASMVTSRSLPVRVVKLVRDYGAVITLAAVVLTVAPHWTIWLVGLFTLINAGFLAASIAFAGRESLRPRP